jgi:hypothetical protein
LGGSAFYDDQLRETMPCIERPQRITDVTDLRILELGLPARSKTSSNITVFVVHSWHPTDGRLELAGDPDPADNAHNDTS